MRTYPKDKYDKEESARLGAKPWQLKLLKFNPEYVHWGPHEDYMIAKGQWNSPITHKSWADFGPWGLDELNEVVNFYFEISRDSKQCELCGGSGYHPDAQWISESFYGHSTPFRDQEPREVMASAVMASFGGEQHHAAVCGFPSEELLVKYTPQFRSFCEEMRDGDGTWSDKITEDEKDALVESKRVPKEMSAADVNAANRSGSPFQTGNHDAINRGILIRTRCARLGVPLTCDVCSGNGHVFTAPEPHVNVVLWVIHPRKGCSRGVEVRITQGELPAVFKYLKEAARRNAKRFAPLAKATGGAR